MEIKKVIDKPKDFQDGVFLEDLKTYDGLIIARFTGAKIILCVQPGMGYYWFNPFSGKGGSTLPIYNTIKDAVNNARESGFTVYQIKF